MHDDARPMDDDDDLLRTIRAMVEEEAAREMPVVPSIFPRPAADTAPPAPQAVSFEPPKPKGAPLVLGAMARVAGPGAGLPPAPAEPAETASAPQSEPYAATHSPSGFGWDDVDAPSAHEADQPSAAPIYDEEALRQIVSELVREEFRQMMSEALDHRIRQVAKRELAALLAKARGADD